MASEVNLPRPDDLPDFASPPLVETVMGAQFATPPGYLEIYAREVWALFETEFPKIQERQALEPFFEVFGGPGADRPQIKLETITGPIRNRFWFIADSEHELIQFQHDRFVHNWRKIGAAPNEYPRFEPILERFGDELGRIDHYFQRKGWGRLVPNQCELTYVNRIVLSQDEASPWSYFRRIDFSLVEQPQGFAFTLQQVVKGRDGKPIGRLHVEANSRRGPQGGREIGLNLTARGAPTSPTIAGAIDFLIAQRALIVRTFAELTSDAAHKKWGRSQ